MFERFVKKILNSIPRPLLIKISLGLRPFIALFYAGSTYKDPIDQKSYRKFLPYGYKKIREGVLAPGTFSLERHRFLWLFLKAKTSFFDDSMPIKLLHMAPEQAFYKRFKRLSHIDYTSCDLDSPIAEVHADICNLPFENNYFDVILCNHVLEHIKNDQDAITELYRVLKPGGWGIFQVPIDYSRSKTFEDDSIVDKEERTAIFGQYDHLRIYGMDFFNQLEKHDFQVQKIAVKELYTKEEIERYRLDETEILPFVQKLIDQ